MVVIGYALINFAQDQFLQPVAMGNELNLSPLVVFIAVVVWVLDLRASRRAARRPADGRAGHAPRGIPVLIGASRRCSATA